MRSLINMIFLVASVLLPVIGSTNTIDSTNMTERANTKDSANVSSPQNTTYEYSRENTLSEMSQDVTLPLSQRIAATQMLGNYSGANALIALGRASRSEYIELRIASITAAQRWQGRARWDLISPLLEDSEPRVRSRAVSALAPLWTSLPNQYQQVLDAAIEQQLTVSDDTTDGRVESAWLYRMRQQYDEAKPLLLKEWKNEPSVQVAVELAELYKAIGQDHDSIRVLRQGLEAHPTSATLHHSLALTYWRKQQNQLAIEHMQRAHELEPDITQYTYLLGLMLAESNPERALDLFEQAYVQLGVPHYLYSLCEAKLAMGADASTCLTQLRKLYPEEALMPLTKKHAQAKNAN
ncbi:hypothetical protein [Vibrio mediterranei]|uniref:hypothetical protein n=1 Tax=Vibrio mediterranei TaxID=689 RepID=UPI001EFE520B|nr:hypothetical protein [Vibrio mediterranei]MCG9657795.1 hypothetical protein [Vibrio mediterranei]